MNMCITLFLINKTKTSSILFDEVILFPQKKKKQYTKFALITEITKNEAFIGLYAYSHNKVFQGSLKTPKESQRILKVLTPRGIGKEFPPYVSQESHKSS